MENLKVKVITSNKESEFEKNINEFAATSVQVIATQTSMAIAGGDNTYSKEFLAVVYYKDKLPRI